MARLIGSIRYDREITSQSADPLAFFAERIPAGATVLDLGCGPGVLGRSVRAVKDATFDGVEGDPEAAFVARQQYRRIIEADLENARLEKLLDGQRYDYIVLADVLEHLETPGLLVRQLPPLLLPGGRVLISIPNVGYAGALAALIAGNFDYANWGILDHTHLRFFTRRSLHRFLQLNGMRVMAEQNVEKAVLASGFNPADLESLMPAVRAALLSRPDALVYQFMVEAEPAEPPVDSDDCQALAHRNVPPANGAHYDVGRLPQPAFDDAREPLFDTGYYLRTYPDVAAAGVDPYEHYIHFGAAEGRDPQALFDTTYYLERYPDVAMSGMNALKHYAQVGAAEGRDPHPLFDASYYAGQAHLAETGENALLHYCKYGFKAGLSTHSLFDVRLYLEQCPEVADRGDNPVLDFLSRRGAMAPRPHILFNTEYYLRQNPDVAAQPINPFLHYLLHGWRENRDPHVLFDNRFYRGQYEAGADGICPLQHYVCEGSRLGLRPHPWFDGEFYLKQHPEVAESGESSLAHYLRLGYRLNYDPNARFDSKEYLEKHVDSIPPGMSPTEHALELGDYTEMVPMVRKHFVDPLIRQRVAEVSPETFNQAPELAVKLIAFYLPQYHAIPENDLWWGEGFTDWRNVARATPSFDGHYQPRVPADLGYYDLGLPGILERQAELAGEYGIQGFCFYHYWFDGHRLLERPLEQMLVRRSPSFPFCICWANENWSRRWDGSPHDLLIEQRYSEGFAERFIRDVMGILTDPNYIRVAGAPLLLVYCADQIPDVQRVTDCWRRIFREETGLELHLAMVEYPLIPYRLSAGFDSTVEFAPELRNSVLNPKHIPGLRAGFAGRFEDYRALACRALARGHEDYAFYRCVMAGWDNTARRGMRARIVVNDGPDAYEDWLRSAVALSMAESTKQAPLVFIFAWNEWAEGAYLEPDQKNGHGFLQATRNALCGGVADFYKIAGNDVSADDVRTLLERSRGTRITRV
jgi:2-polyprenyl-3-methyl-5-hydroxy-6-metoxy-1,4-benzoquinol methylase